VCTMSLHTAVEPALVRVSYVMPSHVLGSTPASRVSKTLIPSTGKEARDGPCPWLTGNLRANERTKIAYSWSIGGRLARDDIRTVVYYCVPLGELDRFKTNVQYRFSVERCEQEIEPEGTIFKI
jgi:hypothetical protein